MKNKQRISSFLRKTQQILNDSSLERAVHWDSSGHSFSIADPTAFTKEVLPQFFKHKNLSSFIRQLNVYGFQKSRGAASHEFSHPLFVRDRPELISEMKRNIGEIAKKPEEATTMNPIIEKTYRLHKQALRTDEYIQELEDKVRELSQANQKVLEQIIFYQNKVSWFETALLIICGQIDSSQVPQEDINKFLDLVKRVPEAPRQIEYFDEESVMKLKENVFEDLGVVQDEKTKNNLAHEEV